MNKYERLLKRSLQQQVDAVASIGRQPRLGHYFNGMDFVLQHGRFYRAPAYPKSYPRGAPKQCFGNALVYACQRGWRYVEGFALAPKINLPFHHAWNVDEKGDAWDTTWRNTGLAYLGVEFSTGRADDATWNGDSTVLDDWHRGWPLFKERWQGEDWDRVWEPSEGMAAIVEYVKEGKSPWREE